MWVYTGPGSWSPMQIYEMYFLTGQEGKEWDPWITLGFTNTWLYRINTTQWQIEKAIKKRPKPSEWTFDGLVTHLKEIKPIKIIEKV